MPEATEIVYLVLREGLNPEEEGSQAAQLLKKAATTLSEQKGFLRSYWGLKVEDPKTFIMAIDWEDVQNHKDFVNSEAYLPFTGVLSELFDFAAAPPFFYHVNFTGDSIGVREAPVTEIAPFHITAGADDASKSALEDHILKLAEFAQDSAGASAFAVGWVIEEQDHSDAPEGKTKLLHLLLGWKSVEEHMKARELEQFPVLIQPVRALTIPAQTGKTVFHVKFHGKK